jgi:hypothetical protein
MCRVRKAHARINGRPAVVERWMSRVPRSQKRHIRTPALVSKKIRYIARQIVWFLSSSFFIEIRPRKEKKIRCKLSVELVVFIIRVQ